MICFVIWEDITAHFKIDCFVDICLSFQQDIVLPAKPLINLNNRMIDLGVVPIYNDYRNKQKLFGVS